MSDLITRLSAELDRREAWLRSRDGHRNPDDGGFYSCAAVREYSIDGEPTGSDAYCDCGYVARREGELRLIEAHRKIVDEFQYAWERREKSPSRELKAYALRDVVEILAEGYGLTTEEDT